MVAVVDYDAGNLASVKKALLHLGRECQITRDPEEIRRASHLILPGVGAFGDAMARLERYGLVEAIKEYHKSGKPLLGICLGLQLLFESSEEGPDVAGLALLPGKIVSLAKNLSLLPDEAKEEGRKIPHMGWNSLHIRQDSRLFKGISEGSYVYFVHSYYLQAQREEDVAATTEYGVLIHAAVERENLFACQFHPEKSGEVGLSILNHFTALS